MNFRDRKQHHKQDRQRNRNQASTRRRIKMVDFQSVILDIVEDHVEFLSGSQDDSSDEEFERLSAFKSLQKAIKQEIKRHYASKKNKSKQSPKKRMKASNQSDDDRQSDSDPSNA